MYIYAMTTFLLGILFLVLGNKIFHGKTNLIHDYHQENIGMQDKEAYGRAFSKGMYLIGVSTIASGIVSLLSNSVIIYVGIFILGFIFSLVIIVKVQRKFNGSIFWEIPVYQIKKLKSHITFVY